MGPSGMPTDEGRSQRIRPRGATRTRLRRAASGFGPTTRTSALPRRVYQTGAAIELRRMFRKMLTPGVYLFCGENVSLMGLRAPVAGRRSGGDDPEKAALGWEQARRPLQEGRPVPPPNGGAMAGDPASVVGEACSRHVSGGRGKMTARQGYRGRSGGQEKHSAASFGYHPTGAKKTNTIMVLSWRPRQRRACTDREVLSRRKRRTGRMAVARPPMASLGTTPERREAVPASSVRRTCRQRLTPLGAPGGACGAPPAGGGLGRCSLTQRLTGGEVMGSGAARSIIPSEPS